MKEYVYYHPGRDKLDIFRVADLDSNHCIILVLLGWVYICEL